jgi:uncharacterized protein (TIGR04562 family)
MGLTRDQLARLRFDSGVLDVVVGGQSAIDAHESLVIRTPEDAVRFLNCYGFNVENPIEKAELFGHYQEAVSFIRKSFLFPHNPDGPKIEIPRKLTELSDPLQLLLIASQPEVPGGAPSASQPLWACAILKVMHTIGHIDKDVRTSHFSDIQTQIMDRFYKHIHNEEGRLFLGKDSRDPELVDLVLFQSKPKKSRDSLILKMLHKPENVAEDIFDRVGLRFVTKTRFDALRLVKFLRDRYIIMPANIKPSRSRNTLVDLAKFRQCLDKALKQASNGDGDYDTVMQKIRAVCDGGSTGKGDGSNPFTSKEYASIQFTCRQLIKITNPLHDDIKALKSYKEPLPSEVAQIINRIELKNVQKEVRFFYPVEIQLYDQQSHKAAEEGEAAHSQYKKGQLAAAMKRVMRGLL